MQIHFTNKFPWEDPTYFIEKIWAGFALDDFLLYERNGAWSTEVFKEQFPYDYDWFPVFMKVSAKLHTIREDKNNRWKPGKIIHFEQWTGKPFRSKCYHFAPLIPCVSTQAIKIKWHHSESQALYADVFVDGRHLLNNKVELLAKNDGFDSVDDFFKWFDKDFTGKIIHWTGLTY